jgi:hypothetical protein
MELVGHGWVMFCGVLLGQKQLLLAPPRLAVGAPLVKML